MGTRVAAWLAAAMFFVVAAFHAALVFGAPWGEYTQGGGTRGALTSSGRLIAAVSSVLSIVMAVPSSREPEKVRCDDSRLGS
jgi:hypothetical protein